jgi:hypothetical protein
MSGCLHPATFPSKWSAKAFIERSRIFDALWQCPDCRFWVVGLFDEAPLSVLRSGVGIFTKEETK